MIPMNPQTNNRLATFFSAGGNVGVTNTVYSVALALSKLSEVKIGVLSLNAWDDGSDYLPEAKDFLDTLKPRLAGKQLDDNDDFLNRFVNVEGNDLYILPGNRNARLVRSFKVEEVSYLIDRSLQVFDVVLIDAGGHIDNALSAQAVYEAGHRYAILTQQPKVLKRFNQLEEDILTPLSIEKRHIRFILNKYQEKAHLLDSKKIAKEKELQDVHTIPYTEEGIISELENRFLYTYTNQKYQASIEQLAKDLGKDMALSLKEIAPVKKGLFRLSK